MRCLDRTAFVYVYTARKLLKKSVEIGKGETSNHERHIEHSSRPQHFNIVIYVGCKLTFYRHK